MAKIALLLLFLIAEAIAAKQGPIWKVFCGSSALFKGRLDPIVNPGKVAGHTHQVSGGNHFSPAGANQSPIDVYNDMVSSSCTTCSIREIDNSAYWHPDLYYQWPNKTFSVVPYSGLTVYYLSRSPSSGYNTSQNNYDVWTPIPKGLRMLAGNPYRRNYSGSLEDQAVSYACLNYNGGGGPETNGFPAKTCPNGLRAQVFFPMCWDGKNLDSPDHKSHMAYPSNYNGGNCPTTHPVRIPGVFFEALYSVDKFDFGTTNPFVWSNGDPTGYGFHGDFLSGWNTDIMAQAISDPSCDLSNDELAVGNNVKACKPFSQYVQGAQPQGACNMYYRSPLTEDLGVSNAIPALPGCNPITNGPGEATPCSKAPNATTPSGINKRFLLQSVSTKMYVTNMPDKAGTMVANVTGSDGFTYAEIWDPVNIAPGTAIKNEQSLNYVSASGDKDRLFVSRGSPSTSATSYEAFVLEKQQGKDNLVAIKAIKNGKYVTVGADGSLTPNVATTITDSELFQLVAPDGGYIGAAETQTPTFPNSPTTPAPSASNGGSTSASNGGATSASGSITGLGQGNLESNASTIMGSIALVIVATLL